MQSEQLPKQLKSSLAVLLEKTKVRGEGTVTLPSAAVPPVTKADMAMDPAGEYETAVLLDYGGTVIQAWIRRAYHAERFAKALEEELERLRHGNDTGANRHPQCGH